MKSLWGDVYEGLAGLYVTLTNVTRQPLLETVLEASLEIGFREFGVSVDRDGICAGGICWTWDEWLAQGDLPPNWKRLVFRQVSAWSLAAKSLTTGRNQNRSYSTKTGSRK